MHIDGPSNVSSAHLSGRSQSHDPVTHLSLVVVRDRWSKAYQFAVLNYDFYFTTCKRRS
ncbi:hypothetical protein BCAR13_520152 [Paraburkholderia caribensis]|nr:hypothetical protein BCAR13_520152 [Paraburkholderia caribensis]